MVHKFEFGHFLLFFEPSSSFLIQGLCTVVTQSLKTPSSYGRDVIYGRPL